MFHRSTCLTSLWSVLVAVVVTAPLAAAQGRKPALQAQPHLKPNVILITIDTLRADHVGCYGAKTVKTPTLDALAKDGVVFERAISQVPLTWPSHAVILTGTYPFQNGVQDFTGQPLAPEFKSVAQAFKQAGYATGAVVSAFVLDRSWGLARGFDFYDDAFSAEKFRDKDLTLVDRRAQESVAHALAWLRKTSARPFFLWLHLYDPHSPYDPPEPYRTAYRAHLYDGEIAYADTELGKLVTWLKRSKIYDSSLIVVLSDHGESLGDHGENEHGFFVYNSTVQVPLIFKMPARMSIRSSRRSEPVETAAVAPSLLQLAHVRDPIEHQFQVGSLFAGKAGLAEPAYSETFYPFSSFGWSPLHALETDRYHYIEAPEPELYDVAADPEERNNIVSLQPATVAVLKSKLQLRLQSNPFSGAKSASAAMNPDTIEKLRALGYVAYRAPVSDAALAAGLPDPKSKLWEFLAILKATDMQYAGDYAAAEGLLNEVREKDPAVYIVPFMLGQAALRQQTWDEAAKQLRACLELNPNFDQAMTALAHALLKLENRAEARTWVERALQYNPQNYRAWYELGSIESTSDKPAAIAALEKAVSIQPNFLLLLRDLGMLEFQEKKYESAAKHLAKAIDLGVKDATAYNYLGICYSQTNQAQKGIESYKRALEIDPDLAEAHLNLGFAYQKSGRLQAGREHYRKACQLNQKFCQYMPKEKP